jgi:hypothetical protein
MASGEAGNKPVTDCAHHRCTNTSSVCRATRIRGSGHHGRHSGDSGSLLERQCWTQQSQFDCSAALAAAIRRGKQCTLRYISKVHLLAISNNTPLWAAYPALMSGRLLGLNKFPGVRPAVGVREKCGAAPVPRQSSLLPERKQKKPSVWNRPTLRAGIEGGIHVINEI